MTEAKLIAGRVETRLYTLRIGAHFEFRYSRDAPEPGVWKRVNPGGGERLVRVLHLETGVTHDTVGDEKVYAGKADSCQPVWITDLDD